MIEFLTEFDDLVPQFLKRTFRHSRAPNVLKSDAESFGKAVRRPNAVQDGRRTNRRPIRGSSRFYMHSV
jgi:hypothetical protein